MGENLVSEEEFFDKHFDVCDSAKENLSKAESVFKDLYKQAEQLADDISCGLVVNQNKGAGLITELMLADKYVKDFRKKAAEEGEM